MPNEPERDIEKLLKTLAQKRRDEAGAPLELHLATRRMLQGEVTRRMAKAPRGGNVFVRMLSELRPRLAFGAAVLAVLLVATWALLPLWDKTRGKVELAQDDTTSLAKLARSASLEVASAPAQMTTAGPEAEAPALSFASARKESQSMTMSAPRGGASQDFEMERQIKMADDQVRDKEITTDTPETASTTRDEAIGIIVAGGPMPPARAEGSAALTAGRYGPARIPVPQPSESASVPSARTAGLAQQAALQEKRERSLLESDSLRKTEVALAPQLASFSSLPQPASAAPQTELKRQVAYSDFNQTPPVLTTQRFAQMDLQPRAARPAAAARSVATEEILTSFRIAQAGDQIQVIDNDGSTYAGFMRLAPTPVAQPAPDVPQKTRGVSEGVAQSANEQGGRPAIAAGKPAASQNVAYFFQVEGTNRTFRQHVVFTGNLLVDSDVLSAKQSNAESNQRSALQLQQNGPTPTELQNSRIAGQAVIGDGRTLQINAAPASP